MDSITPEKPPGVTRYIVNPSEEFDAITFCITYDPPGPSKFGFTMEKLVG